MTDKWRQRERVETARERRGKVRWKGKEMVVTKDIGISKRKSPATILYSVFLEKSDVSHHCGKSYYWTNSSHQISMNGDLIRVY